MRRAASRVVVRFPLYPGLEARQALVRQLSANSIATV